jgi:hypothetical protein
MLALVLSSACADGGEGSDVPESRANLPVVEVPARWASAHASSLDSLIDNTGTVFVGKVTRSLGQREADVGSGAPSKAKFPISSFEIRVISPLRNGGRQGDLVVVEQPGGVVDQPSGKVVAVLEGDEPLAVGKTYLFFSTTKESGALTSPPFGRFEMGNDGRAQALKSWGGSGVARALEGLTVSEASARVRSRE